MYLWKKKKEHDCIQMACTSLKSNRDPLASRNGSGPLLSDDLLAIASSRSRSAQAKVF